MARYVLVTNEDSGFVSTVFPDGDYDLVEEEFMLDGAKIYSNIKEAFRDKLILETRTNSSDFEVSVMMIEVKVVPLSKAQYLDVL